MNETIRENVPFRCKAHKSTVFIIKLAAVALGGSLFEHGLIYKIISSTRHV